jgi:GNAT superfamily N-acetyltransferase
VRARRGKEERWHQVYNPPAHARSVACARGLVWQVRCQQWLLVHVLEARRRLPGGASRGEQRGVTPDRQAWFPAGLARVRRGFASGWCQLTPREALPWLDHMWWFERVDAVPVWSISCFFVRRDYRRQGVMTQLIFAALKAAKRARAPALEGYPIDTSAPKSTSNIFTGTAAVFARAGFKVVARRASARPIMRHDLKAIAQ